METTINKKTSGEDRGSTVGETQFDVIDEMDGRYLTFWSDNQIFGIPISNVQQIVGIEKITAVPQFPEYAKGIINLRGSIIPIIDVRLRFHKQEIPYNERTCIIVTNIRDNLVGLVVDAVDEVTMIEDENIANPPKASHDDAYGYLTGIAKIKNRVILLLNAEKIFYNDEIKEMA